MPLYEKEIIDYPCGFDPDKTAFKEAFSDPVSLALWVAYRGHHICDSSAIEALTKGSIYIRDEIKKRPELKTPEGLEDLKFLVKFYLLSGSDEGVEFAFHNHDFPAFFKYVHPYLIGEKIATIKIMEKTRK